MATRKKAASRTRRPKPKKIIQLAATHLGLYALTEDGTLYEADVGGEDLGWIEYPDITEETITNLEGDDDGEEEIDEEER